MSDPVETKTDLAAPAVAPTAGPLVMQPQPGSTAAVLSGEVIAPKKKRRGFLLPLIALLALGGGGYEGYRWFVEGRFLVSTDDAYVKADMSTIAAKVPGYVTAVPIVQNVHVAKGDVLATIDDGDYRNAVETAQAKIATQDATIARFGRQVQAQQAMIDQAKAQLGAAKSESVRTGIEYDRASRLMQSSFGTQQRLDQALADRDRDVATVASATAAVSSAASAADVLRAQQVEATKVRAELVTSLDKANRDLSFTVIRAPFDGVVGNKAVQPGQYVQTGTRLLSLVPLDSVYVEASFKETQIDRLKPGQKVTIKLDALSGRTIEGQVESIAPASGAEFSMLPPENATGNFTKIVQRVPVRIKVPLAVAEEGILRAGLSVDVEVHTRDENAPPPSLVSALGLDAVASAVHPHRDTQAN